MTTAYEAVNYIQTPLEEALKNEWIGYIKNHHDIGLVTLVSYHKTTGGMFGGGVGLNQTNNPCNPAFIFSRFLLSLILIIQIFVPLGVVYNIFEENGDEFKNCKGEATLIQKLFACAVAVIYFAKLDSLGIQKHKELKGGKCLLTQTGINKWLQKSLIAHQIFYFGYVPIIYLVNLVNAFIEPDSYTIIINALALQFIIELSNVAKSCSSMHSRLTLIITGD